MADDRSPGTGQSRSAGNGAASGRAPRRGTAASRHRRDRPRGRALPRSQLAVLQRAPDQRLPRRPEDLLRGWDRDLLRSTLSGAAGDGARSPPGARDSTPDAGGSPRRAEPRVLARRLRRGVSLAPARAGRPPPDGHSPRRASHPARDSPEDVGPNRPRRDPNAPPAYRPAAHDLPRDLEPLGGGPHGARAGDPSVPGIHGERRRGARSRGGDQAAPTRGHRQARRVEKGARGLLRGDPDPRRGASGVCTIRIVAARWGLRRSGSEARGRRSRRHVQQRLRLTGAAVRSAAGAGVRRPTCSRVLPGRVCARAPPARGGAERRHVGNLEGRRGRAP